MDTVDFHAKAWRRAFEAFEWTSASKTSARRSAMGGDQLLPVFLSENRLEKDGESIEAFRSELFKREYPLQVRGFPNVRELFDTLLKRGIVLAL